MPNLHRLKPRTWRAEDDEVAAAIANLPAGKAMTAYIRAAVIALGKDPEQALSAVEHHWPEDPKPVGRPRKPPPAAE